MGMYVTALNSGSNGNCFYLGNEDEAILVDVGISCREIVRRMEALELSINKVKAIFISHEHSDHIRGLKVLAKKYQLPVYCTAGTVREKHIHPTTEIKHILPFSTTTIGNLSITAFPKNHDAHDPQSFVIKHKDICVGVFTDIGHPCEHVIKYFKCCHAVFLETNYDPEMLENGHYPFHLKRRISGHLGHLSNQQALELFNMHRPAHMSHLFLSHLSEHNNHPQLVQQLFEPYANGVEVIPTSRSSSIPVYQIDVNGAPQRQIGTPQQLSLFG